MTTGEVVSEVFIFILYESMFDEVFVLSAASEKTPVHTPTVIAPVATVGVTVKVYPVELCALNPLIVAFVSDISPDTKSLVDSAVVAWTEMAHEIVLGAVDVSVMLGRIVSSVPMRSMPEATTAVAVLPE